MDISKIGKVDQALNVIGALIVGIILLVVGYMVPWRADVVWVGLVCRILGWILVIVAFVLIVLELLGVATPVGTLR